MLQRRVIPDPSRPENPVVFYASPLLESIGVPHAFSTRLGGVSRSPFDTMNLGNPNGCDIQDPAQNLANNHARLFSAAGLHDRPRHARVHQVHANAVALVRPGTVHDPHAKADALVSDDPDSVISVRVADCVPVLLSSGDGAVVAAVHAGWRGVVSDVVGATVLTMRQLLDESAALGPTPTLIAAIGPGIRLDAFEVGDEVVREFITAFGAEFAARITRPAAPDHAAPSATRQAPRCLQRPHIDLHEAVRLQLVRHGIAPDHIDSTDRCTFRDAREFFSHRRDRGVTGRMAALIAPRRTPRRVPIPRSSPASHP
ncbi:MAG: peptidoglycan editing factor PgeF [Phycisphaerales bacterium]